MNDNGIVLESAHKIRQIARDALRGNWFKVAVATLIFYVLFDVVSMFLNQTFSTYRYIHFMGTVRITKVNYGAAIYALLVRGAFSYGLCLYFLNYMRTRVTDTALVFEGFSHFLRAFLVNLIAAIKVFLWSLLFVIPGILAALRYSMSFFVMADHPELTAGECIEESKNIMSGNKMKYFILQLSFIGWAILATAPTMILNVMKPVNTSMLQSFLLSVLCGIPYIFLNAYKINASTAFYELATGRLAAKKASDLFVRGFHTGNNGEDRQAPMDDMFH